MTAERGIIQSVEDPLGIGRARVKLLRPGRTFETLVWAMPLAVSAGAGHGFFVSPVVGDKVVLLRIDQSNWSILGFYWDAKSDLPEGAAAPTGRVLTTPAGHRLKFDDAGDVEILHSDGSRITLKAGGEVEVSSEAALSISVKGYCSVSADAIKLNSEDGAGVVTTRHICAFTGGPHPQGSKSVSADGSK